MGAVWINTLMNFSRSTGSTGDPAPTVMSPPWLTHIPLERLSQWIQGALSKPRCLALEHVISYLKFLPKWYSLMTQLLSDSNLAIINFLKSPKTAVSNFYQILNQREMSQTSPASSRFLNTLIFFYFLNGFSASWLMTIKSNSRQEGVRLLTVFHPVFLSWLFTDKPDRLSWELQSPAKQPSPVPVELMKLHPHRWQGPPPSCIKLFTSGQ